MLVNLIAHPECKLYTEWSNLIDGSEWAAIDLTQYKDLNEYLSKGLNATARNRYGYSVRHGYRSQAADNLIRNSRLSELYAINTSKANRQGRPMGKGYMEFPKEFTSGLTCKDHLSYWVFCYDKSETVRAYITVNQVGELAAASQILGHADYLNDGIMLNVWVKFIEYCFNAGIKAIVYGRPDSGTKGLQYWKHSVGLTAINLMEEIK